MSKSEKIRILEEHFGPAVDSLKQTYQQFQHNNSQLQQRFDEFSENTISNFIVPYGVVPNLLMNEKSYVVPMVTEESSVVAAAAKGAKYWAALGGFQCAVIDTEKVGHIHFLWNGGANKLTDLFNELETAIREVVTPLTWKMKKRQGGLKAIQLINKTASMDQYYQLRMTFETCNAMGANFINTVLETAALVLKEELHRRHPSCKLEIIMSILSNYTPECLVRAQALAKITDLAKDPLEAQHLARRLHLGFKLANVDKERAVTHNKGIMNGIDSVVMATGNDFRAVEACAHAYAARDGAYRSLSWSELDEETLKITLELPVAVGTVGGLTSLHPLAKSSLDLLGQPDAKTLMMVCAAIGLAQNFSAVRSLVTTGIQKGHMKMHLLNILNSLHATESEKAAAKAYFTNAVVSYAAVDSFIQSMRVKQ